jgi:hypothetical protein
MLAWPECGLSQRLNQCVLTSLWTPDYPAVYGFVTKSPSQRETGSVMQSPGFALCFVTDFRPVGAFGALKYGIPLCA